jgi:hypothetical protein
MMAMLGLVQGGKRPGFALEARDAIGIGDERFRQDFDRDIAIELRVARPVDFTHSARTDLRDDFTGAETSTDAQDHRNRRR